MSIATYPTATDVQSIPAIARLWPSDGDAAALYAAEAAKQAAAAWQDWERTTGYIPFLAGATATTRTFDGTSGQGLLQLGGGIVTEPTVTISGTTYTLGTQYWLSNANALAVRQPYDVIQFLGALWGWGWWLKPQQFSITAKWGYAATLEELVWDAIRGRAGARFLRRTGLIGSGVLTSQSHDGESLGFTGAVSLSQQAAGWDAEFNETAEKFTRVVV